MDSNPEDVESPKSYLPLTLFVGLIFISIIYMFSVLPVFKYLPINPIPAANVCLTNRQLVILGKPLESQEAEEVLIQIKDDLKTNKEVTVLVLEGSYWVASGILAASFPELQPDGYSFSRYYIVVDSDFYKSLNSEEKKAVIAHEMGHIDSMEKLLKIEMEVDSLATKYVSPQTFIDMLNKAIPDKDTRKISKEYKLRIENLEKLKQSRQGH